MKTGIPYCRHIDNGMPSAVLSMTDTLFLVVSYCVSSDPSNDGSLVSYCVSSDPSNDGSLNSAGIVGAGIPCRGYFPVVMN